MLKDDVSRVDYVLSGDPTAGSGLTFFPPFLTLGMAGVSITLSPVSGTLNGTFKVQTTDFGAAQNNLDTNRLPASTDWVDYPASTNPATAAAISAAIQWQIWPIRSRWLRVVFTDNSSSLPLVNVAITGRTWA